MSSPRTGGDGSSGEVESDARSAVIFLLFIGIMVSSVRFVDVFCSCAALLASGRVEHDALVLGALGGKADHEPGEEVVFARWLQATNTAFP